MFAKREDEEGKKEEVGDKAAYDQIEDVFSIKPAAEFRVDPGDTDGSWEDPPYFDEGDYLST